MEGKHQLLIHNKKGETGVVEASTDKKQATQFKKNSPLYPTRMHHAQLKAMARGERAASAMPTPT
jgi:hypothetical protein